MLEHAENWIASCKEAMGVSALTTRRGITQRLFFDTDNGLLLPTYLTLFENLREDPRLALEDPKIIMRFDKVIRADARSVEAQIDRLNCALAARENGPLKRIVFPDEAHKIFCVCNHRFPISM